MGIVPHFLHAQRLQESIIDIYIVMYIHQNWGGIGLLMFCSQPCKPTMKGQMTQQFHSGRLGRNHTDCIPELLD